MSRFWKYLIILAVTLGVAATVASMVMVIWPGSFKLTAPLLCPDDRPDAFVVRYETSNSDGGTSTNFSLYCMNDRGEYLEIGTWEPFGLIFLFIAGGMLLAVIVVMIVGAVRRVGRGGDPNAPPDLGVPDPFTTQTPIS